MAFQGIGETGSTSLGVVAPGIADALVATAAGLFAAIPGLRDAGCDPDSPFTPTIRDVLLRVLFSARSDLVIVPFQDLYGWRDRVNVPAVVNDENWTWRLPWPIDDLSGLPEARERAGFLRALAVQTGRSGGV